MKDVLDFIEIKQQEYSRLPFFEFLRDSQIDPRRRLAFAPHFAFFTMSFAELNRFVWRNEPTADKLQSLLNHHTYEDDHHWPWFLEDLQKLGYDPSIKFTESLRFLWSDDMLPVRQTIYQLFRHTFQATPVEKLIAIESVEATAGVFLPATRIAALELGEISQQTYHYFGECHTGADCSHAIAESETLDFILSIQLTEEEQRKAIVLVESVFQIFTDLVANLLTLAQTSQFPPLSEPLQTSAHPVSQMGSGKILENDRSIGVASSAHSDSSDGPDSPFSAPPKPLGQYLLEAGLVNQYKIDIALKEQQLVGKRLGEVLADLGWVPQPTVEYLMDKVILPERHHSVGHRSVASLG